MTNNSSPEIVCHSTLNECMVTWINAVGYYDHHVSWRKGRINDSSGSFEFTGTGWFYTSGLSSRLAADLAYGAGYWLLSVRANDPGTPGYTFRQGYDNWPHWSDRRSPASPLLVSPTVVYGNNEFVFSYIRR